MALGIITKELLTVTANNGTTIESYKFTKVSRNGGKVIYLNLKKNNLFFPIVEAYEDSENKIYKEFTIYNDNDIDSEILNIIKKF